MAKKTSKPPTEKQLEARRKFGEAAKARAAAKKQAKTEAPVDEVAALKARIAELEKQQTAPAETKTEKSKDEQIVDAYQSSRNSIQDIARIFGVSVEHVLQLTGNGELVNVTYMGDMVDTTEVGNQTPLNYGQVVKVPYTAD